MAEPEKQYEYGRIPEETSKGLLGVFNFMRGPLVDAFTPERREVITPPEETYGKSTPGEYGPPETGLGYMPVVQGHKGIYEFGKNLFLNPRVISGDGTSAKVGSYRDQTGEAVKKGLGQLFGDYYKSSVNLAQTGQPNYYDPKEKREVSFNPLLPLEVGMAGAALFPVKGAGFVAGMFAGRNAATAKPAMFSLADNMSNKGRSRDEIYDQTGLFRYQDKDGNPVGDWRFEIPDDESVSILNKKVLTTTSRLRESASPVVRDLLRHDKLSESYPGSQQASEAVDYLSEYKRIQDADELLLRKYSMGELDLNKLEELRAPLKVSLKSLGKLNIPEAANKPLYSQSVIEKYPLLDRPILDIGFRKLKDKQKGSADYMPYTDTIGLTALPGQAFPKSLQSPTIPWDKDGKYVQTFSPKELAKNISETKDLFKKEGYFLDVDNLTLATDLKDLPFNLRSRLDEIIEGGKIYKKDDFDPTNQFRSSTLHELQHAIQQREGFEQGGSMSSFGKYGVTVKDPDTGKKLTKRESYMRLLGEAEARNVQTRRDFTDQQRKDMPPWTTLDRPESKLYTRGQAGLEDYTFNSNLDLQATVKNVTQMPSFKNKFGNSKIVDDKGAPLQLAHGGKKEISEFETGSERVNRSKGKVEGFYFTNSADAEVYGPVLTPVFLSIRNPLLRQSQDIASKEAKDLVKAAILPLGPNKEWADGKVSYIKTVNDLVSVMENAGVDGAIQKQTLQRAGFDGMVDGREYVAFDPNQVILVNKP